MSFENINQEMQFYDCFQLGDFINQGQFGDIYKCIDNETKKTYTVKVKDHILYDDNANSSREGTIWRRLKHRNIVELLRVFRNPTKQYLVMEDIDDGNLFDQVVNFTTYTENDACYFMKQLFEVLTYLREKQVIHRNIRSDNLLLKQGSYGEVLKLTDFDLAIRLKKGEEMVTVEPNGVPLHVAPETILEKPVGFAVDTWAAGIILYTLLGGYPPFWNERPEKLYAEIITKGINMTTPFWDNVSPNAKDLISKLLDKSPVNRIDAEKALKHPWIIEHENIPKMHRRKTVEKLKEFNARRKLRGAIFMVQTLYRMKTPKRSSSHGGNSNHIKHVEPDRRASTSIINSRSQYPRRSSVISETNHEDLPNERKLSEVKIKYQPIQLVINLSDIDKD